MRRVVIYTITAVALLCTARLEAAQSVALAWDASTSSTTVGYMLYLTATNGSYAGQINVGTNLSATIPNLAEGVTYQFSVVAYDAEGNQSTPSNEILYFTPGMVFLSAPSPKSPQPVVSFAVAPSHWYELQASGNVKSSWSTVWQTAVSTSNAMVQYNDTQAADSKSRFYRLILH